MKLTDSTRQKFYQHITVQEYNKRGKLHKWVNILASRGDDVCRKFLHDNYGITFLPTSDIKQLDHTYTPPRKPSPYDYIRPRVDPRAPLSSPTEAIRRPCTTIRYTYQQLKDMILEDKKRKGELVLVD